MLTITTQTPNDAYPAMIQGVLQNGVLLPSRVAPAQEVHPAAISIQRPLERLVTAFGRPVNVAFALAEVLWILQGRKDVAMLRHYNSRISDYSDDSLSFNAAYGARLRMEFGIDQLLQVERILQDDPESRQASLVMSHPVHDRGYNTSRWSKHKTKDRACNVYSHLMIRDGALDWMQVLRSNDALWGTPYNWMQFTHLQEFIATRLGVPVGKYTHIVDSLHIYDHHLEEARHIERFDLYGALGLKHAPMTDCSDSMMSRVYRAEEEARLGHQETVMGLPEYWHAVITLLHAHTAYRERRDHDALFIALNSDPVYATAQVRFWYHHRWHQDEYAAVMEEVRSAFVPDIFNWITSSTSKENS